MKKFISLVLIGLVLIGCSSSNESDTNSSKKLVVGMECNYAPHNWTQAQPSDTTIDIGGGQYCDGYDVDIARLIATDLDRELVVKKISWDSLIPSLQNNDIDLIIAGMSPTSERKMVIDFTEPYTKTSFGIVVKKDGKYSSATSIKDFKDAKVTAQLGTAEVNFLPQMIGIEQIAPMKDFPSMAVAVSSNQLDGFIGDKSTGLTIVKANPDLMFIPLEGDNGFEMAEEEVIVSMGIKKGNDELLTQVNNALAKIDDETRAQLKDAAMQRQQ